MRLFRGVIGWLLWLLLTACVASHTEAPTAGPSSALTRAPERPTVDRLLTQGDIQVAEAHLRAFGFDPGPVDGIFTAQTQAAVRAFQARYGISVSGLLDRATREELLPGLDVEEPDPD
jgi:peptidoglycan hydrolase-like protein with peptidoglycan-binding domain